MKDYKQRLVLLMIIEWVASPDTACQSCSLTVTRASPIDVAYKVYSRKRLAAKFHKFQETWVVAVSTSSLLLMAVNSEPNFYIGQMLPRGFTL